MSPAIEPLFDSLVAQIDAGPYALDVRITLASGGHILLSGSGLDRAGMHDLLDIVRQAVGDS